MKNKIIILLSLFSTICYGQGIMPGMTIIGKDTLVTANIQTVRVYNNIMADLDACNKLADSLYSYSQTQRLIIKDDERYMKECDDQNSNFKAQIQEYKTIGDLTEKQMKRAKRQGKVKEFGIYMLGAVVIVETIYIVIKEKLY